MKQSLNGILEKVAARLQRDGDPHNCAFVLRQLCEHLKEVKARHDKGESAEVLTDFFNLYVFEEPNQRTRDVMNLEGFISPGASITNT